VGRLDRTAINWIPATGEAPITGLSGTSPRDLWATGGYELLHWDGTRWTDRRTLRRGGHGEWPCGAAGGR
jgi:hypothetical protein